MPLAVVVPLLLVLLVATVAGAGAFVLRAVVLDSFERLEISAATLDLERFVSGLSHEMHALADDVTAALRHAAAAPGDSGAEAFVSSDSFAALRLNIACVYGADGEVSSARFRDRTGHELAASNPMELCYLPADHPLMSLVMKPDGFAGLFDSDRGLFMLVGVPAETAAAGAGKERVLAGRIFDEAELQRINQTNHISIDFWSMRSPDLQVMDAAAGAAVSLGQAFVVNAKDEDVLQVYRAIPDVLGTPAFLARANIQRELRDIGTRTTTLAVVGMVSLGISVIVLTIILLRYLMVLPLAELTRHMLRLRHHGDTGARLRFRRRDEIGLLADEFGRLLDDLDETSRRFAEASYRAGQADVAEGVLHNVGNVLNSLSVSAHAVLERAGSVSFDRMESAAAELAGADRSIRQQKLVDYLQLGLAESRGQFSRLTGDARRVIESIKRIESILEGQRQFGIGDKGLGAVRLGPAVQDALAMLPAEHLERVAVVVDESVWKAPPVLGQKPAIQQILVNLMKNAAEAIKSMPIHVNGRIDVIAEARTEAGRQMIDLQVRDNGLGFGEGDAVRVFQRGFSTKGEGGRGIGLHWSAGMAASLHGHLRGQSDGPNRGAVFHLTLPVAEGE